MSTLAFPTLLAESLYWRSEKARGRGQVLTRLEWLEETQWLSPTKVAAIQAEKLGRIVEHAYKTVPYYRRVFEERGLVPADVSVPSDLVKLPLLTRSVLKKNQEELVSSLADRAALQTNHSSGSTGQRATFKQDIDFQLWMRAHQLRTYRWCADWKIGERFVLLWGSEMYWSLKSTADSIRNIISNRREFNTFSLSNDLIKKFTRKLLEFNPVLISTYSNAMHLIAREMDRLDAKVPALRAIQGTSEPFPPALRTRMESVFACETYDKYGSRETNIVSHESPLHDGMLIQSENVVPEFIGDDGVPCAPGERGRVILTTLNNWSMPLIRYETSDIAGPIDGYCRSGRGLPRMTHVAGRQQDLIITPRGDYIDAYYFSYLMMQSQQVDWFQVIQRVPERLHIRLLARRPGDTSFLEELKSTIRQHTGVSFDIDFEVLDEMPSSPTGKFRLCISEVSGVGTVGAAQ